MALGQASHPVSSRLLTTRPQAGAEESGAGPELGTNGPAGPLGGAAPSDPVTTVRRWKRVDVGIVAGLVLLAFSITLMGVVRAPSLSAYDEATHIDYAWSVSSGSVPFAGSQLAPDVLQEWSCRGQDNAVGLLPPCGENAAAAAYPNRGENYNFIHPPLYYGLTGAAASVLEALPLGLTFVTAARLTGGIWLAAALAGMFLVLRAWRASWLVATTGAMLLAAVPSVAHASSIVTNDAPGVLAGVLALWVLTRVVVQERLGWWVPAAVAFLVASVKGMHSVPLLAVAGVVLLLAVSAYRAGDRTRARRLGLITAGIVGAIGAVHTAWSAIQASRATPYWVSPVQGITTDPVVGAPVGEWLPTLFSTFGIAQTFWLQSSVYGFAVLASARLLSVVLTAAPFANVSAFPAGDRRRLVGWTALLGCAAVTVVVQLQAYLSDHHYFPNPSSRYGISLLPLTVAAIALVAHARGWRLVTVLLGTFSIGALLVTFSGMLVTP